MRPTWCLQMRVPYCPKWTLRSPTPYTTLLDLPNHLAWRSTMIRPRCLLPMDRWQTLTSRILKSNKCKYLGSLVQEKKFTAVAEVQCQIAKIVLVEEVWHHDCDQDAPFPDPDHPRCLRQILSVSWLNRPQSEITCWECSDQSTIEETIQKRCLGWFEYMCRIQSTWLPSKLLWCRWPSTWKVHRYAPKKTWTKQVEDNFKNHCLTLVDAKTLSTYSSVRVIKTSGITTPAKDHTQEPVPDHSKGHIILTDVLSVWLNRMDWVTNQSEQAGVFGKVGFKVIGAKIESFTQMWKKALQQFIV